MPHADGSKSGGRKAGTPNKGTKELREFLERVFARVFTERITVTRDIEVPNAGGSVTTTRQRVQVGYEDQLVQSILTGTIDEGFLKTLLQYYAGKPTVMVDVDHSGSVTLEQLITGNVPKPEDPA